MMKYPDITRLLPGLELLWRETKGSPDVPIAVLDGPVDGTHECFEERKFLNVATKHADVADNRFMSAHGTHIASLIFGRHDRQPVGIAPNCPAIIAPIFSDDRTRERLSQLDVAIALNQAVEAGAKIVNISGGQSDPSGAADPNLEQAIKNCRRQGVLITAAVGNDGCRCLHVPAAVRGVLAVGALDESGKPAGFNNWGDTYFEQGVLAPGTGIIGAAPGGGLKSFSGSSFAAPLVTGVAALLMCILIQRRGSADPEAIRAAILESALSCSRPEDKCLTGILNIPGALALLTDSGSVTGINPSSARIGVEGLDEYQKGELKKMSEPTTNAPPESADNSAFAPSSGNSINEAPTASETAVAPQASVSSHTAVEAAAAETSSPTATAGAMIPGNTGLAPAAVLEPEELRAPEQGAMEHAGIRPSGVAPSACGCEPGKQNLIYALGTVGYDFGTEAVRDAFTQHMAPPDEDELTQANPYDPEQMVKFLEERSEWASYIIWTLSLGLTPIYAIRPDGAFEASVYETLVGILRNQILEKKNPNYIAHVSIPGVMTGTQARLFSGQIVNVVKPANRGIYGWNLNSIKAAASDALGISPDDFAGLDQFLNLIYYKYRNLGITAQERALNYTATNVVQATEVFRQTGHEYEFQSIEVNRSPYCRKDSDCWDVKLYFFNPGNVLKARRVFLFTLDVSTITPVTLGEAQSWNE